MRPGPVSNIHHKQPVMCKPPEVTLGLIVNPKPFTVGFPATHYQGYLILFNMEVETLLEMLYKIQAVGNIGSKSH